MSNPKMTSLCQRLFALALVVAVTAGCPREQIDRCSGDDPHPECDRCTKANPDPECPTTDMGSDVADAGDLGHPDTDAAEPDVPPDLAPDLGPCGGCSDPLPLCDEASGACVECLQTADCTDGVCEPTTHTCVECVAPADCPDVTASACDPATNTCMPCATSADCAHLVGTTVCDAGECVECTGLEYDPCAGSVCDSRLRTCTTTPPAMTGLCQTCVSDAQCRPGMLCAPMTFDAADGTGPAEVGTYCLWRLDATEAGAPNGACSTVRPYIDATELTSLDGVTTDLCGLRTTTCPGLNDFDTSCPAAGMNDACGAPGFDDAFCVMFDAAANLCTVPCGGDNDCKPGFTCDTTVTPNRCEL